MVMVDNNNSYHGDGGVVLAQQAAAALLEHLVVGSKALHLGVYIYTHY